MYLHFMQDTTIAPKQYCQLVMVIESQRVGGGARVLVFVLHGLQLSNSCSVGEAN